MPFSNPEDSRNWSKDYYEKTKDKQQVRAKKYYQDNKDKLKLKQKLYASNNYNIVRNAYLIRRFGISLEQYNEMLRLQDGSCYICKRVSKEALAVDHSHTTNTIRKLLCRECNTSLGLCFENKEILQKMISYLEEHEIPKS